MKKPKFEYNTKGYEEALKYLKETGNYELTKSGFSTDGWSITLLANNIFESNNKTEEDEKAT